MVIDAKWFCSYMSTHTFLSLLRVYYKLALVSPIIQQHVSTAPSSAENDLANIFRAAIFMCIFFYFFTKVTPNCIAPVNQSLGCNISLPDWESTYRPRKCSWTTERQIIPIQHVWIDPVRRNWIACHYISCRPYRWFWEMHDRCAATNCDACHHLWLGYQCIFPIHLPLVSKLMYSRRCTWRYPSWYRFWDYIRFETISIRASKSWQKEHLVLHSGDKLS